ncbi:hypothetical protein CPT_Saba_042 [Proteus phage Saba]|uniref:Uncharacterized protein n=1 Tax=Proteus phage Saba TaxID=2596672 RepID=A0A5B9N9E2_9CAUD|nr:hypothetical protein JT320_gp42 [Proteus phage Saba]QEG09415.1 hypothetical protein CPT_Saba_042 [Proteus phage Saba]
MTGNVRKLTRSVVYSRIREDRVRRVHRNVVYTAPVFSHVRQVIRNVVYFPDPLKLRKVQKNIVYTDGDKIDSPGVVGQYLARTVTDTSYQFEISNSRITQFVCDVVIDRLEPLPISFEEVASYTNLVAVSADYDTTSLKIVGSYTSHAAQASIETRPSDVWSASRVQRVVTLACVSMDVPYVPRSGVDVAQQYNLAIFSSPIPFLKSPASVPSVRNLAAQRDDTIDGIPLSHTKAGTVYNLAAVPGMPPERVGAVETKQVRHLIAQTSDPDPYVGSVITPQVSGLVAFEREEEFNPISRERVGQAFTMAVLTDAYPWETSPAAVTQNRLIVAQKGDYVPPISYFVLNTAVSVTSLAVYDSDYGPAQKIGYSEVGALPILSLMEAPKRFYPPLGEIVDLSKGGHVAQFANLSAVGTPGGLPISPIDAVTVRVLSSHFRKELTPKEIAESGVFVGSQLFNVLRTSEFTKTSEPQSNVSAESIALSSAVTVDYPDIRLPLTVGQVDLVAFNSVSEAIFPDVKDVLVNGVVSNIGENVMFSANYPPVNTLNSLLLVNQTTSNVAHAATFPDKDRAYSSVDSSQVAISAASAVGYNDKDTPQSFVSVSMSYQNTLVTDPSLYQMPLPTRKHRVRVVCKMIYGLKK